MTMSSALTSSSTPLYCRQEDVEDLEQYRSGGFHPVVLDSTYNENRYHIIHKLGYGTYSTVWLARDCIKDRYVSLKVLTARTSTQNTEKIALNHLQQRHEGHPGERFFMSILDEFTMRGTNGYHKCLVSEVLGPTVWDVMASSPSYLLPLDIAKQITVQLAHRLVDIHSCGMIHGDIHIKNIAYKIPNFDSWSLDEVHSCLGSPVMQAISRNDGKSLGPEAPSYAVVPANLLKLVKTPSNDISFLDFGEASLASNPRKKCHSPIVLKAPEALFGEPLGQPTDIWAFACTVFVIFNNRPLFECGMLNAENVLSEIVDALGRLPEPWWKKWERRADFYEEDGSKKTTNLIENHWEAKPLAVRIRQMRSRSQAAKAAEQLSEEDFVGLQQLLEQCLRYKPEDRVTAKDILNLDWIKKLSTELPGLQPVWGQS